MTQVARLRKYKWRLYADNDVEREIVDHLRASGMDVLWISEDPRLRRQTDDEFHYEKARQLRRYLLTRDQDFWDDHKHPLAASPGVLILAATALDVAKYLPILIQKLMDANNPLSEPIRLDGMKVRMASEGFAIKGIDHDTQQVSVDSFLWKELF
jgi:predicted nuclease of predicted toxin-antitoxin system